MRFATEDEISQWTDIIIANPDGGNILQGTAFISLKASTGWKPHYLISDHCAFVVLEKKLPLLGTFWYCPKGPGVHTTEQLAAVLPELREFSRAHGVFTVKMEPELDHNVDLSPLGLLPSRPVQQNFATVLINLSPSLDDIMKAFHQKGRHAIKRAERDGVTTKRVDTTDENCALMYNLLKETADGAGFPIRPAGYYRDFYRAYGDDGQLFFAYFEGALVAGAFAMVQGQKSMYKDGASIRQRTAYGASHLLQWDVIQWAKERGSREHDLVGVPPIERINDPTHPFYGLGRFKTSFNKTVTQFVGAADLPVRPLQAKLWNRFGEKLTRRLYFERHHQSFF